MHEMHILRDLAMIFAVSAAGLYLGYRLKLPPIVGFLVAGFIIGPYGFRLVTSLDEVEILAEIGVVLLLFTIGIEFSIKDLLQSKRAVLLGGSLQVGLTLVIAALLSLALNLPLNQAVFFGFLVALSSTAIVLRALQDRGELDSAHGRITLSVLIFQDIIIAPMIIFTPLLAGGSGEVTGSIVALVAKAVLVVAVVFVLARWVMPWLLDKVARTRSRELFLFSIVLICIAVAWFTNELGLSLGLGAFLAGLIVSESEYSLHALEGVLPFKMVFTGFFFVSIGMLMDTSVIASEPMMVVGLALGILLLKSLIAGGVALLIGASMRTAIIVGLALGQVGEFSFILSKFGLSNALLSPEAYKLFLSFTVITMAATPFIINLAPRLADRMSNWPLLRIFKEGSYRRLAERTGRFGQLDDHLIIIGFGLNGRNVARAARAAGISYVAVEMNPDTVRSMRDEGLPIMYGDGTSREMLHQLGVDRARIAVVAISDPVASRRIVDLMKRENPNVYVIVRTRFVSDVKALLDLGADEVIPEEFETSVEIFTRVLAKYLVPREDIESFTSKIRADGYAMFRSIGGGRLSAGDLRLSGIEISSMRVSESCTVAGKTLAEARMRQQFGVNVLAVMRGEQLIVSPDSSERIEAGDILYIAGKTEQCARAGRAIALGES